MTPFFSNLVRGLKSTANMNDPDGVELRRFVQGLVLFTDSAFSSGQVSRVAVMMRTADAQATEEGPRWLAAVKAMSGAKTPRTPVRKE